MRMKQTVESRRKSLSVIILNIVYYYVKPLKVLISHVNNNVVVKILVQRLLFIPNYTISSPHGWPSLIEQPPKT